MAWALKSIAVVFRQSIRETKQFGYGVMIYHTKKNEPENMPKQKDVEPIIFLSKLLTEAEASYWRTEL